MAAASDARLEAATRAVERWRDVDLHITPVSLGADERHYLIDADGELFMLRLTAPLVDRPRADPDVELAVARAGAAVGAAPEVVASVTHLGCLVTRFVHGRPLEAADLMGDDLLAATIGAVRALHSCPPPSQRRSVFREAKELSRLATSRGVQMPVAAAAADDAMRCVERLIEAHPMPDVSCHGDLTNASVLVDGSQVRLVDFRWAGAGDPFEDLATLCTAIDLSDDRADAVLHRYFGSVHEEHRARLALMRLAAKHRDAMRALARAPDATSGSGPRAELESVARAGRDGRLEGWVTQVAGARR